MRAFWVLALVWGACDGGEGGEGAEDPTTCGCADGALPAGFYRLTRVAPDGRTSSETEQLERDGGDVEVGFSSFAGDPTFESAITGEMTGCQLEARRRIDIATETFSGVWSCEEQRITGTVFLDVIQQTSQLTIEPVDPPWLIDEFDFRLYGSAAVDLGDSGYSASSATAYIPASFDRLDERDWVLIGQGSDSASFAIDAAYPVVMLSWPRVTQYRFDALTDEVAGVPLEPSLGDNASFIAHATADPEALAGQADGLAFAGVSGFAGFLAITFPRRGAAPELSPETGEGSLRVELAP